MYYIYCLIDPFSSRSIPYLSLLFDKSPPFSYSEESLADHFRTFSIENLSLVSIIANIDSGLAFILIPSFIGSVGVLLKFVEMCDTVALTAAPATNPLFLSIIFSKL
jgi:hypothetical protein